MESNQQVTVEEMAGHELHMIKCVVVGDTGVGKTRLICSRACGMKYTLSQLMQTHVPTVWAIDQYRKNAQILKNSWSVVDGVTVSLRLWDTFGDHGKDRRFAYGRADVILVCFSVVQPRSSRNVVTHWFREIQEMCPGIPVILCGCQVDLRYLSKDPDFVKMDKGPFFREILDKDILLPESGRMIAKQIGASYYEVSVLESFGIDTVFVNTARAALVSKRERHFWTVLGPLKNICQPHFQRPYLPPKPCPPKLPSETVPQSFDVECLLSREDFCDIVFLVRKSQIKAHKVVLCAASAIFEKIVLDEDASEVKNSAPASESVFVEGNSLETLTKTVPFCTKSNAQDAIISSPSDAIYSSQERLIQIFHVIRNHTSSTPSLPMTTVAVDDKVSVAVFQAVLTYLYTGKCPQSADLLPGILSFSQMIGLNDLAEAVRNIMNDQDFMNLEITARFLKQKNDRLRNLIIAKGLFSDVIFGLDDGLVSAHRVLLVARSEVMSSMFSYEFKERSAKLVAFPGVSSSVFTILLEFLYTGSLPELNLINSLELIELANRLCQSQLLSLTQEHLVAELTNLSNSGQNIAEDVLMLIEPAQLHNAAYLYDWCLWYLMVDYDAVYKNCAKLLHSLRPALQIYITNHRWPPAWYHREYDIYEKNVLDSQRQKSIRSCFPVGSCGCFSKSNSQQSQKIKYKSPPFQKV